MCGNTGQHDKTERSEPPSLADIVRQETDNGRTIVRFYLDVANGKLDDEGFQACHRVEAAMQIQAIAPELVAEAIARLAGVQCHPERRGKHPTRRSRQASRRSRAVGNPSPDADRANAARRHEALEYLASALAAPSLADDPRVAGIVRESTDQGKTVVSFLLHIMHGVVRGFRPNNRMQAAMELIGHIARDELRADAVLLAEPALSAVEGSFPRRREPIAAPAAAKSSLPAGASSFPRRACPVLDTGREPIPGPAETDDPRAPHATGSLSPSSRGPIPGPKPADADLAVIPAESLPRTRYGAGIQGGGNGDDADALEDPDNQRGLYDIDRKIAEAQRDPAHPIHKFVQAYDEVAAAFHGDDNDDDEEVRYWISGEVPDAYGKYIWEYAPAHPRSIRRRLRPRRRRRSTPKAESVWMKRPTDKMREAGVPPPKRTLIWV